MSGTHWDGVWGQSPGGDAAPGCTGERLRISNAAEGAMGEGRPGPPCPRLWAPEDTVEQDTAVPQRGALATSRGAGACGRLSLPRLAVGQRLS